MATSVASGGGQLHFIDTGFKGRGCRQAYGLHNISVPKCSQKDISWSPGVFKSLRINKNNYLLHQSKENNNLKQIRASCLRDGYSKYFDFAVIGSGVAGLCYALEVAKYGTVAVITKAEPHEKTNSFAAIYATNIWSIDRSRWLQMHLLRNAHYWGVVIGLCSRRDPAAVVLDCTRREASGASDAGRAWPWQWSISSSASKGGEFRTIGG